MGAAPRYLALGAASLGLALAAPAARAAPTALELRVEGKTQTLFEGPIASEGHNVEASSDSQPRSCNGINPNVPENTQPGATATAAAADAMALIGESFDGNWYSGLGDYLITRWGPQRSGEGESWFLLINSVLSDLGGCQFELHQGAQVLWAYDPSPSKLLALYPAGSAPGAPPLTATATLGAPFAADVAYRKVAQGRPPAAPESTGFAPYAGASVAPVSTSAQGFETVQSESPQTVVTDAEGKASITFVAAGWHRLKAIASGTGLVRSNRLDVCVPSAGASDCGAPPPEDQLRNTAGDHAGEHPLPAGERSSSGTGYLNPHGTSPASGSSPTALRIGGRLLFALDARSPALHYRGRWRLIADRHAFHRVVAIGGAGASVSVRLGGGRAAFIVRAARGGARVQISATGRSRVSALAAGGGWHLLLAPSRARAGVVRLHVLSGTVGIAGVGLTA
jgi:hypothetical protein